MPVLIFETGPNKGQTIRLEADRIYTLGRDERAEIRVDNELTSRSHAKLRGKDGRFFLKDADSSNGTVVNDQRLTAMHELASGDKITIGTDTLTFFSDADAGGGAGKTLGGYQLLQRLGRGGMGTVYRALQLSLKREVALKLLAPELAQNAAFVERFFQEARAAGQLNHPNIVQVYNVEREGGLIYYAMELLPGGTVEDRINKEGPLPLDLALGWLEDAARGLEYAQLKKVVHRDIKPDNLMLTEIGSVKIADLGLALSLSAGSGESTGILGTPHFISPEQAKGQPLDTRSDLYSLGATFYRMITGKTVFHGEKAEEIVKKQIREEPPDVRKLRPEASDAVAAILAKLLQKDPAQRFQTATELVAAIGAARARKRSALPIALAALVLIGGGALAAWKLGLFAEKAPPPIPGQPETVYVKDEAAEKRNAELAAELERQRRELEATGAYAELSGQAGTLAPDAYLARLREIAAKFETTAASAAWREEIAQKEGDLAAATAAAKAAEAALENAVTELNGAVEQWLSAGSFAPAYARLDDESRPAADVRATDGFRAAEERLRARIDASLADALAQAQQAAAAAIGAADFAQARQVVDAIRAKLSGAETVPESDAAARALLASGAEAVAKLDSDVAAAEKSARAGERTADLKRVRAVDWPALYAAQRAFRGDHVAEVADAAAALITPEYRAWIAPLKTDDEAFATVCSLLRQRVAAGGLKDTKVQHPQRSMLVEIVGITPDGAGLVVDIKSNVGKSRTNVPFEDFDTVDRYLDLAAPRLPDDAATRALLVRGALAFAAAHLHPAAQKLSEQLRLYDPSQGWTAERRGFLANVTVPAFPKARLLELLGTSAGDAESQALAAHVERESRAYELAASALQPFRDSQPEVRFGLAADAFQAMRDELRDTHAVLAAYDCLDGGIGELPLSGDAP